MNIVHRRLHILIALAIIVLTIGCSGGASSPNPPASIVVSFASQPTPSLQTSATVTLIASVSNDPSNAGLKWSAICGSSTCGSFSTASTASGASTVFTAPSSIPIGNAVTVTATSVADPTKSVSSTITITSAPAISVVLSTSAPSSMLASASISLVATVINDSTNAGVKWSVTCGGSACGNFNPTSTLSGTATTYTAPSSAPSGNTITLIATSVADPTKSVSATVTITTPPPSVLGDGTYIYNLSGQDTNGTYFLVGAFIVKNGAIISGEQDFLDYSGGATDQLIPSGSSINTSSGNIQVVLATSNTNIGVNGIETLRGTLVSNTRMLVNQFDNSASANGSIDLQTSNAALAGGYAFMLNGNDNQTGENQLALGGVLNFRDGTLLASGSIFDYNDSGTIGQAQTFTSGTVSTPDAFGRVDITLVPASSSLPTIIVAGYIIGSKILLIENWNDNYGGTLGGVALSQGGNTGKFSQIGVAGQSYAFGFFGQDSTGYLGLGGGFALNANSTVSGSMVFNDLNLHNGNTTNGNYTVDSTGRVTLSNITFSNVSGATFAFQLYLDGNGNAVGIGLDSYESTGGLAYLQNAAGPDYEGNFALTQQGILNAAGAPQSTAVGRITISSDNVSGFTDNNSQGINPTPNVSLTGTEDSSKGLFHLTGLNAMDFVNITSGYGYYPIDATHVLGITVSNDQISIMMLEGVTFSGTTN